MWECGNSSKSNFPIPDPSEMCMLSLPLMIKIDNPVCVNCEGLRGPPIRQTSCLFVHNQSTVFSEIGKKYLLYKTIPTLLFRKFFFSFRILTCSKLELNWHFKSFLRRLNCFKIMYEVIKILNHSYLGLFLK